MAGFQALDKKIRCHTESIPDPILRSKKKFSDMTGHALESMAGGAELLIGLGPAANHKMVVQIFYRQRVTTRSISQLEPTLEIDRPDMVRIFGLGQLARFNRVSSRSAPTGLDHAVAF